MEAEAEDEVARERREDWQREQVVEERGFSRVQLGQLMTGWDGWDEDEEDDGWDDEDDGWDDDGG